MQDETRGEPVAMSCHRPEQIVGRLGAPGLDGTI